MNDENIINCSHLAKRFEEGGATIEVLHDINLTVKRGERVAIIGSSGAGKSTLLHLLGGLDTASGGDVIIAGKNMMSLDQAERGRLRNRALGFVYQFHHLLPEFTALENVCMPLLIRGESPAQAVSKATTLLDKVGLSHRLTHKPGELSGGERQRAAVARALVTGPSCVLADEPTGNLDQDNANKMYNLMIKLNEEYNTSFVIVTHESALTERMDRVIKLENGVLIEQ